MKEDLSMSAAEYVLGTLGAEERKAFARMAETDADARAALREWEQRFEGLNEVVEPLAPAPAVWSAIEKRLDDATTASNVVTLRRSVVRWRTATGLAGALAASLALFVIARPPGPPAPSSTQVATAAAPAPQSTTSAAGVGAKPGASGALAPTAGGSSAVVAASATREEGGGLALGVSRPQPEAAGAPKSIFVAALSPARAPAALVARVEAGSRVLVVRRLAASIPAGSVLELWAAAPGAAPRALGRLDGDVTRLVLPSDLALDNLMILASLEPVDRPVPPRPSASQVYEGSLVGD